MTNETKTYDKTKAEMESDLQANGAGYRIRKGALKKDLQTECERVGIATKKTLPKKIIGWHGKPKGLLQVCHERGLVDETKTYTRKGIKDQFGNYIPGTDLDELLGQCSDFLNEKSLLQHHAEVMGVCVLATPKCHAELAGEGVEYAWACSKGKYRNLSLSKKRGKTSFRKCVDYCLSEEVLSLERVRKFSKRARQYIQAYHSVDQGGAVAAEELEHVMEFGPVALDCLIKKFKTHRCALDLQHKFVINVLDN